MRLMGVVILVMALGLLFAPPFVGQIPLGIAVCLVGLGLVDSDGDSFVCRICCIGLCHDAS